MSMYLNDYSSVFAACASRNTYGFHVEDWIYWRINHPPYPIQNSLIVATLGTLNSNYTYALFRCPCDRDDTYRALEAANDGANGSYNYSYSMTSYDLEGSTCLGMASIKDNGGGWHPFKSTRIKNPAKKIMLAEEQSVLRGPECSDPAGDIINDGRWVATGTDRLTSRHNKRADVGWADAHVSAVTWK